MFMLEYIYGKNYKTRMTKCGPSASRLEPGYPNLLLDHVEIFILGDKYDISSLSAVAADRFEDCVEYELASINQSDPVVFVIQKLVGPDAVDLGNQRLAKFLEEMVIKYASSLSGDFRIRELLAKGAMLREDLAIEYPAQINDTYDK
jgi:hypothetical protein